MLNRTIIVSITSHRRPQPSLALAGLLAMLTLACADDMPSEQPSEMAASADERHSTEIEVRIDGVMAPPDVLEGWIVAGRLALRFEARRGPETPLEVLLGDPDAPLHEIDVRFIAQSGQPFVERIGGHAFVERAWSADTEVTWPETAPRDRQAEWELMRDSVEQIRRAVVNPDVEDLREVLVETIDAALIPAHEEGDVDATEVTPRSLQTSNHVHFEVWWKWANLPNLPDFLGHHSSTRTMSHYASGGASAVRITCNHGQCAASAGMSLKAKDGCPKLYLNRSLVLPPLADCMKTQDNENYSSYSCCATKYGVSPDDGMHVCHDDTRVQNALAAFGSPIKALGYCSDNDLAQYAPPCGW
jgi:hypothetical protein